MADQDDGADKTFDPTPQRLAQARKEGNVPSSPELQTLARFLGILVAIMSVAGALSLRSGENLIRYFDRPEAAAMYLLNGDNVLTAFAPVSLLFFAVVCSGLILAILAVIAQQAVTFSPKKIMPKLSKINPMSNAVQKFGPNGLMEFAKGMTKMTAAITVGIFIAINAAPRMIMAVGSPPAMFFGEARTLLVSLMIAAVILAVVASAIEYPFKFAQHRSKLKMSREEIKQEAKDNEGDPEQKQTRQRLARQITSSLQMKDVPKADVIIVNPTHYAVALKWDREAGEVPRCVAKGTDLIAQRIREIAEEAKVPLYRDVQTARSLHAMVEVGDEVQREHYEAVAAAIRFADKVAKRKRA